MSYPRDALAPHEELVLDLRPHWLFMAPATAALVGSIVLGLLALYKDWPQSIKILCAILAFGSAGFLLVRYLKWSTTHFVLTSERVMSRKGVVAKAGIEIPLERINTVLSDQSVFERLMRLGDLEIESASTDGAEHFEDLRRPAEIQKEIYIQIDRKQNRGYERMGHAVQGVQQQAAPGPASASIPDQIAQLDALRQSGAITEQEFQTKKADLLNRM